MLRRSILFAPLPFVLLGCANQTGTTPASSATPASVIAFAKGAVDTLLGVGNAAPPGLLVAISKADPALLPASLVAGFLPRLSDAETLLAGVSTTTAALTSATTLQSVEGDINDVMSFIGGAAANVPALAPYVLLVDAISVATQIIEQFVNSQFPAQATAALNPRLATQRAGAAKRGMTPELAAARLGVRL